MYYYLLAAMILIHSTQSNSVYDVCVSYQLIDNGISMSMCKRLSKEANSIEELQQPLQVFGYQEQLLPSGVVSCYMLSMHAYV